MEILGKPQEHVEQSMKEYLQQLQENKHYTILHQDVAEIQKQQDQELWATFAELEVRVDALEDLTAFCFDYMPSMIEIIEPQELLLADTLISTFLNDLQARLHQIDMIAKQAKMENDILKKNTGFLLKNYLQVLLDNQNLTSEQLSKLTGVPQDQLEDFMDTLIDQGLIDLKQGIYFLTKK